MVNIKLIISSIKGKVPKCNREKNKNENIEIRKVVYNNNRVKEKVFFCINKVKI